jgi:hypothetical protein
MDHDITRVHGLRLGFSPYGNSLFADDRSKRTHFRDMPNSTDTLGQASFPFEFRSHWLGPKFGIGRKSNPSNWQPLQEGPAHQFMPGKALVIKLIGQKFLSYMTRQANF